MVFAPLAWLITAGACSPSSGNYPPVAGGPWTGGGLGSTSGGGGGEGGGGSICADNGGVCTAAGNICPVQIGAGLNYCGGDGGASTLICCGGFNDSGPVGGG